MQGLFKKVLQSNHRAKLTSSVSFLIKDVGEKLEKNSQKKLGVCGSLVLLAACFEKSSKKVHFIVFFVQRVT
jgi:hypothetical protein